MSYINIQLTWPLKLILFTFIYFGMVCMSSNGFITNYEGINYFAIISGLFCIIFAILLLNRLLVGYYGLTTTLILMIYVLPISAHKLDAAGIIVQLIIILRDPISIILIFLLVVLNILLYHQRQDIMDSSK
jgi:hypothetical protein